MLISFPFLRSSGFVTETDVDMGTLVYKHELSKELVDDFLALLQATVDRSHSKEEPFAMDYKGLKARMAVVKELQEMKPDGGRVKPTAAAVRVRCVVPLRLLLFHSMGLLVVPLFPRRCPQLDASFRREKQLRSELAVSRQTALQQHDLMAKHFAEVCFAFLRFLYVWICCYFSQPVVVFSQPVVVSVLHSRVDTIISLTLCYLLTVCCNAEAHRFT